MSDSRRAIRASIPCGSLDPDSLETLGRWDFYGKWKATSMSAHPKIDPMTGEMIAYGYQAKGILSKDIAVYTINPQGHIVKEVWLQSPYLGIIHDIAITQKHVIIPVISRTTNEARLKSGEPMWEWQGDLPTMVGILPRDGEAKDVRWFNGDATPKATLADWHIDDMWGVYPRPSEPIGFGRPYGDGEVVAAAAAADLQFLPA